MRANSLMTGLIWVALCGPVIFVTAASADTARVNGFEMYFETVGQGQPLLLLHGFTQVGAEWDPIRDELASEFRLIIPDLRGHGSSTNPSGEFTMRQSALDVLALLDHLEIDRVQAMGFSAGANTLLHMATQQPERIEAMVLIGGSHCFSAQSQKVAGSYDPTNISGEYMEELRSIHKHGEEQIQALLSQMYGFKDSNEDMNITPPHLSTISARTLIMLGDRDRFVPVNIAFDMYEAIPNSYLWIVPNMDHQAMWGPVRDHFLCTATAFLKDQWQSRPARLCE